jgi:RNA polymerase sigma-70 factor (ECF subfamily)
MAETSVSLLQLVCRAPGSAAWMRLTEIYSPLLEAILTRYRLQPADVEDLIQEVFLTLSRELPQFEHSGRTGAFRSWLRTIVVHRLRNFWRSQKYEPLAKGGSAWADELDQLADESSAASREWNIEHDRHVMGRLLEHIRPQFEPKTWEAFRRQMFDGQRADIVAAELEMPLNSVYVARSRVLSALRREAAGLIDE